MPFSYSQRAQWIFQMVSYLFKHSHNTLSPKHLHNKVVMAELWQNITILDSKHLPNMRYFISLLCFWHAKWYLTLSSCPSTLQYTHGQVFHESKIKGYFERRQLGAGRDQEENKNKTNRVTHFYYMYLLYSFAILKRKW